MIKALGIVNIENSDVKVSGLQQSRTLSAISIFGRYRMIDFILSNYTNSNINEIHVYCADKPRSLIEHMGTGGQYNINSKRGKLRILLGESECSKMYNTDIENFVQNLHHVTESNKEYVVVAPSYMLYRANFQEMIQAHIENKSDVTILYKSVDNAKEAFQNCDCLTLNDEKRITAIEKNRGKYKTRIISTEAYVMHKSIFIQLVKEAYETSSLYWLRDILIDHLEDMKIDGYPLKGPLVCINSLQSYFDVSMAFTKKEGAALLRNPHWPILTITNDSAPTVYGENSEVQSSMIANGCQIDGHVEECVIGRNVVIKKGAVLKRCVILHSAQIGEGVYLENVVVDKKATISKVKKIVSQENVPFYVKKRDKI